MELNVLPSSRRRCREDRSPSVEIIYEGTFTSSAAQPPAHKRHRKRRRRTQDSRYSLCPQTLSLSRTVSQHSLSRVSSPVIITLDSDSSRDHADAHRSSSSSPISSQQTVDFSDLPPLPLLHSPGVDRALGAEIGELPVDILDRGSDGSDTEPVGRSETSAPIAIDNSDCSDRDVDVETVEENGSRPGSDGDKGTKRGAESTPAANQREADGGGAAVQSEVTSDSRLLATIISELEGTAAPECGPSLTMEDNNSSNARTQPFRGQRKVIQGSWLAETRHRSPGLSDGRGEHQGLDSGCRVREEGKDLPPLLKQASPVRSHNRNTPPPLKHKYDSSPRLFSPHAVTAHVELTSADPPVDSRLGAGLPDEGQAIPPISTLKRHFTNTLAAAPVRFPPSHSHPAAASQAGPFAIQPTNHKPPLDLFYGSDHLPHLDINSFRSSKMLPGLVSDCRSSPVDPRPARDFPSVHADWSKDKSAVTDSTSEGCRTVKPDSCVTGAPRPSSCNKTPPTGSVLARKTENPSEQPSPSRVSTELTTAASVGSLASDVHSLTANRSSSLVIHEEAWPCARLLPNDLNGANKAGLVCAGRDGRSNHTAFSASQLRPADPRSEDSCRDVQIPTGPAETQWRS